MSTPFVHEAKYRGLVVFRLGLTAGEIKAGSRAPTDRSDQRNVRNVGCYVPATKDVFGEDNPGGT